MTIIKNEKTLMVSFKLPRNCEQKLNERVIAAGYGMKGKSRWVREAVEELLQMSNLVELVGLSIDIPKESSTISVRIPRVLVLKIEQAIIDIRREYPELEGMKSRIIRTAIIQRLLRS